jgi:hypothetical protein
MSKACVPALLALAALSSGCGLVTRPVDVYSRAYFIVDNWNNPQRFPHQANLCMDTFCRRFDTAKKYVGGHRGYTSQVFYRYCPEHRPSFVSTGTRLDGFFYFVYWAACFFIGWVAVGMVITLPVVGVHGLWLLARGEKRDAPPETLMTVMMSIAGAINLIVFVMFAYWCTDGTLRPRRPPRLACRRR